MVNYSTLVIIPQEKYNTLLDKLTLANQQIGSGISKQDDGNIFHINQLNQNKLESGARVNIRADNKQLDPNFKNDKIPNKIFSKDDFYPPNALDDDDDNDEVDIDKNNENINNIDINQEENEYVNPDANKSANTETKNQVIQTESNLQDNF